MNVLDVYDATLKFLQTKIDLGESIEISNENDINEFMEEFDEWMKNEY